MACMKLGSKPEVFRLHGHTWHCSSGLPSDVIIEIGEFSFHFHKFPLLSRSRALEDLIGDSSDEESKYEDSKRCILELHDIPGGAKAFLLVAKFCYDVKIELTPTNIVSLRCAAEYLQMTEDYGEGNLITQTETFLNQVFCSWIDTIKALESCEEVIPHAEELHIVSRCITSLAMKACADPTLLTSPAVSSNNPAPAVLWNGIRTSSKAHHVSEDWWYDDVSFLRLPLYKRLILAVGARGMKPERIAGSLVYYAHKYLPLTGRQSSFHNGKTNVAGGRGSFVSPPLESDQRALLEEIVELFPDQKGVISTKLLLRILRTSIILRASLSCREALEKRVGAQLNDAVLEDILIPNMGYSMETLYDIDCVQRIVEHFVSVNRDVSDGTSSIDEEGQVIGDSHSLNPLTIVANLVDSYLAEVAPDVNMKLTKFETLAALIPESARQLDDGIYRAIDIYLKTHPWLTDSEREQLCSRLMNCQKLSIEASTHAAQNERLPLRVIVQVLFFEQLRLRTSVAGWLFVSDNSQDSIGANLELLPRHDTGEGGNHGRVLGGFDDTRERVYELEKECSTMKQEIEKLVKTKGSWNNLFKMLGLRLKPKTGFPAKATKKRPCNVKVTPPSTAAKLLLHGKQNQAKHIVELGC